MNRIIVIFFLFFGLNFVQAQINLPAMRGLINSKPGQIFTMFSGGKGYGTAQSTSVQQVCSPFVVESIYYGGEGYGSQNNLVVQSACSPQLVESIYYGGEG
jgi:hypothetical protein